MELLTIILVIIFAEIVMAVFICMMEKSYKEFCEDADKIIKNGAMCFDRLTDEQAQKIILNGERYDL